MNRSTLPRLARLTFIIIALASAIVIAAPTSVKQVHPTGGSASAPVVIAVLADNYTAAQEEEFDYDVENFFKYGLLVDGYYEKKKNDIRVVSLFEATPAGQPSLYDFQIAPGVGNCAVINAGDAVGKINAALAAGNLHATHTIVLGNYPYNFGCTDGSWTYVSVDAIGTDVLQHEFGHVLGELFDEWSTAGNKNKNYPSVISMFDTRNCWSTRPPATKPPHWKSSGKHPNAKEFPECDLYGRRVVHPFEYCRMGTKNEHPHHPAFCEVCAAEMDATFLFFRNWRRIVNAPPIQRTPTPQASHAPSPRFRIINAAFVEREREREQDPTTTDSIRILRFRVEINPVTGAMTAKGRTDASGIYVPSYRRNGRFAFEYVVNGKPVEVGVIPDHLFEARGFRGGAPAHRASDEKPAEVVIAIPNEDSKSIQAGGRQLRLYRIPNDMPGRFISLENFETVRGLGKPTATVDLK
jgi:hypothetical protein